MTNDNEDNLPAIQNQIMQRTSQGVGSDMVITRAMGEIQSMMVIAKRFPRDTQAAEKRILDACKRVKLAEQSQYLYPRAGGQVSGPSIRLAEVIAQNYGNLDVGIVELERDTKSGESNVMAYALDLETNYKQTKIFTVRHVRDTKSGQKKLSDERDIYEMVGNLGARRLRACILGVIPGDVVEAAIEQCNKTMSDKDSKPMKERLNDMVEAFLNVGVSKEMLEKRVGHKLTVEGTSETELVTLRKIFLAIRDGMGGIDQYFEVAASQKGNALKQNEILNTTQPVPKETVESKPPQATVIQKEIIAAVSTKEAVQLSQYEIQFGQKYGTRLSDIPLNELEESVNRMIEVAKNHNQALEGKAKEFVERASLYIQAQKQTKEVA